MISDLKWILDKSVDPKNMAANAAVIPERTVILDYFKTHSEPKAYASSNVFDNIGNCKTDIPCVTYSDGEFRWTSTLVYYFEKYNVKLSDEFIQHVLNNS